MTNMMRCRSLLLAAMLGAVPAAASPGAGIERHGVLKLELSFAVDTKTIPDGTQIFVNASANVGDATFANSNAANTTLTVQGGTASTTLSIYYTWLVGSTADEVTIFASASGDHGTYEDIGSAKTTIALPGDGATTALRIGTTL